MNRALPPITAAIIATLCLSVLGGVAMTGSRPAAANSPAVCAVLSPNQLQSWFGKAMKLGNMADIPQSQGCQWVFADGDHRSSLTVQIVPARYYLEPNGLKRVPGIGQKAYVAPSFADGWEAGALKGSKAVVIGTPKTSQANAIAVLKKFAAKL